MKRKWWFPMLCLLLAAIVITAGCGGTGDVQSGTSSITSAVSTAEGDVTGNTDSSATTGMDTSGETGMGTNTLTPGSTGSGATTTRSSGTKTTQQAIDKPIGSIVVVPPDTKPTSPSAPSVETTEELVQNPNNYDLGGRTVLIYTADDSALSAKYVELRNRMYDLIEESFNCTLKFEKEPDSLYTQLAAGKCEADIIPITGQHLISYYLKNGYIAPLNYLYTVDGKLAPQFDSTAMYETVMNGKYYTATSSDILNHNLDRYGIGVFFNKNILKEAGVNPDDMYTWQKNGQWTWDKMIEVAQKVRNYGKARGIYGLTEDSDDANLWLSLILSNDSDFSIRQGAQLVMNNKDSKFIAAVNKWQEIYNDSNG